MLFFELRLNLGRSFFAIMKCHFGPSWSEVTVQLPDKLSKSDISANSSGIKTTSAQLAQKLNSIIFGTGFVQKLHEVISRQIGEKLKLTSSQMGMKCNGMQFTCSQIGNKSGRMIFQNNLCPSWSQVQKRKCKHLLVGKSPTGGTTELFPSWK